MASVFTYDPDPPKLSSPWLTPLSSTSRLVADPGMEDPIGTGSPQPSLLADCGITRLEAEPQEGPTEVRAVNFVIWILKAKAFVSINCTYCFGHAGHFVLRQLYSMYLALISRRHIHLNHRLLPSQNQENRPSCLLQPVSRARIACRI